MAEYLVQDSSLEAIADAIRERTGSGASIAFPDGFIEAIANMGGGVPVGFSAMESGEYIPSADSDEAVTIAHTLGVVPDIVLAFLADTYNSTASFVYEITSSGKIATSAKWTAAVRGSTQADMFASGSASITNASFEFNAKQSSIYAGKRYMWLAFVLA